MPTVRVIQARLEPGGGPYARLLLDLECAGQIVFPLWNVRQPGEDKQLLVEHAGHDCAAGMLAMREAGEVGLDDLEAAAAFYDRHVVKGVPPDGGLLRPPGHAGEQGYGETCPVCGGRGWATETPDSTEKVDCPRCQGDGVVWVRVPA